MSLAALGIMWVIFATVYAGLAWRRLSARDGVATDISHLRLMDRWGLGLTVFLIGAGAVLTVMFCLKIVEAAARY